MIPEIGHFALILALAMSVLVSILPMAGALLRQPLLMTTARSLTTGLFVFSAISFVCLCMAFLADDFSVTLVSQHSNSQLPAVYKFTAVWGNHEGSMLLWILMLTGWGLAVALFSRSLDLDMVARVLSVMGMISVGFIAFSLLTSNPFERSFPAVPADGNDLNPLLQDFGMIVHPPMLYMGYVGFSVVFAFAIAALTSGRLDAAWARWSRPWTNVAWMFLTLGILLGSWWAYYELGWGGWWFWDPVENASFMPWLAGTALVHSLAVTEKRGLFKSWTVLLAIFAFSLSLLGTFLVRSGVLTSVHSFAADPDRGLFILVFLGIVVGGSLVLYALRAPAVSAGSGFQYLSREAFLLLNNVVLVVSVLTVLFGTLFPLLMDALGQGKYSVGPPYFNAVFVPLMAILMLFMAIGPLIQWKKTRMQRLFRPLLTVLVSALILSLLLPLVAQGELTAAAFAGYLFSFWLIGGSVADLFDKLRNASDWRRGLRRLTPSYYGMHLAHIGFAVTTIGVCMVSQFESERDVRMVPGETVALAGYEFRFLGSRAVQGPNFTADEGVIEVRQDGELLTTLHPQKRMYTARQQVMTEADIDPGLFRDIYVAMGDQLQGEAWAIRLHYKPLVRWIWLGGLFMSAGAALTLFDRRYRRHSRTVDQSDNEAVAPEKPVSATV